MRSLFNDVCVRLIMRKCFGGAGKARRADGDGKSRKRPTEGTLYVMDERSGGKRDFDMAVVVVVLVVGGGGSGVVCDKRV